MTAAVLVHGKLYRDPEPKTSSKGTAYAIATVRDGQGDAATWWKILAFSDDARDELLTLRDGDGLAVSGTLKAEVFVKNGDPRVSLSVMADRLISLKKQKRERATPAREARGFDPKTSVHAPTTFDDSEVPF